MSTLDDKITFLEGILQTLKTVTPEDYDLFRAAFLDTAGVDFRESVRLAMSDIITATVKIDPETDEEIVEPFYPDDYTISISPADPYNCTQGMLVGLSTSFLQTLLLYRWANNNSVLE